MPRPALVARPADRTEQDRLRLLCQLERRRRQRHARSLEALGSYGCFLKRKIPLQRFQDPYGLRDDLLPDPVSRQDRDLHGWRLLSKAAMRSTWARVKSISSSPSSRHFFANGAISKWWRSFTLCASRSIL